MNNTQTILLLIAGIGITAVVAYLILRPKTTTTTSYTTVRSYSNNEEWQFTKDSEGRVLGVTVKREAKEN